MDLGVGRTIRAKVEAGIARHGAGLGIEVGLEELGAGLGAVGDGTSCVCGTGDMFSLGCRHSGAARRPGRLTEGADGVVQRLLVDAAVLGVEVHAGVW